MSADGTITAPQIIFEGKPLRGADLFCGAGGLSEAMKRAAARLRRRLNVVGVNHWQVAINTNRANHPDADLRCADLEHIKPLDVVPGGILDILAAAPACTFHSRARGGKPVHDQQRMDPWHVVRWCTDLRVHRLLVENVPEFMDWGPCNALTGKPIKSRKGEYFRAWCEALRAIGFKIEWRVICCADHGDATTRERFFLMGRSDGKRLRFPEPKYTKGGGTDLLGTRLPWRSAAEIIDWSRPGKSIFTRKKPLVNNTLRRLLAGAKRNHWPRQHCEALQALMDGRTPRLLVSRAEAEEIAKQLGTPLVMGTGSSGAARPTTQPVPTITTGGASSPKRPGNARPHFAQAVIVNRNDTQRTDGATGAHEPIPTATARGAGYLAQPIIGPYYGSGSGESSIGADLPLPAQGTKARFGVAVPVLANLRGTKPAQLDSTGGSVEAPVPGISAKGIHASIAVPTIIQTDQTGARGRISSTNEPTGTSVSKANQGLAIPFLVPNFGEAPGQTPRTHAITEPAPTATSHGAGNLAQPVLEEVEEQYMIDILYRMLHWTELARATSFEDNGIVYKFTGTDTEITKQIGNAVPIRTGTELIDALLEV